MQKDTYDKKWEQLWYWIKLRNNNLKKEKPSLCSSETTFKKINQEDQSYCSFEFKQIIWAIC